MKRAVPGRPRLSVRLARTLALDTNPLRRASDRAEAWIRVVLIAVFLIAGPMAAQAAAGWAHHAGTAASAAAAQMHAARAILLQSAPAPVALEVPYGDSQVRVRARWQVPGAPARTGEVLAPRGLAAGSVVTVWLTASGQVTGPPPGKGRPSYNAALTVPVMLVVVALTLLAVLRLIQRFLNAKRLAAWEAAWSAVAPRWTGHRPVPPEVRQARSSPPTPGG
jgi:hypothetical protein